MKKKEALNSTIQIRVNLDVKAKAKYLSESRGYKNLSEYFKYLMMKDISESEFKNMYSSSKDDQLSFGEKIEKIKASKH